MEEKIEIIETKVNPSELEEKSFSLAVLLMLFISYEGGAVAKPSLYNSDQVPVWGPHQPRSGGTINLEFELAELLQKLRLDRPAVAGQKDVLG